MRPSSPCGRCPATTAWRSCGRWWRPRRSPASWSQTILTRAEGNPFFLEELSRSLGDEGGERAGATVPGTVQDVLAGRIARLEAGDSRLLQAAAVVGKDVAPDLLRAIADEPDEVVTARLQRLQAAGVPHRHEHRLERWVHVQARADPRGRLSQPAARRAPPAARPPRRGAGGARRRPHGRAGRAARASRPRRGAVGAGRPLPASRGDEDAGAVGQPRGRRARRPGPGRARSIFRTTPSERTGRSRSTSRAESPSSCCMATPRPPSRPRTVARASCAAGWGRRRGSSAPCSESGCSTCSGATSISPAS